MPNIADIRKQFPNLSHLTDYDIVGIYAGGEGISPETAMYELGVRAPNAPGFVTGVKQGLGGFVEGVGRVVDDASDDRVGALTRYGREVQQRNPSSEASQSWEGFKNNPWQGVKELAGQGTGSTAPSIAAFAIPGGQGAGAAGVLGTVGRGLQTARAIGTSGLAQTALAAAPMYGQIRDDQDREGYAGTLDDKIRAAAAATAGGWVETKLGVNRLLNKEAGLTAAQAERQALVNSLSETPWKTARNTTLRSGLEEGAEELVQQPMQQWGAYQDPTSEQSLRDTGWSGFGGVVGGLALAPIGGLKMGRAHAKIDAIRQADLLNSDIGSQADQAQWERAFLNRDGQDVASWYDQRMNAINQRYLGQVAQQNLLASANSADMHGYDVGPFQTPVDQLLQNRRTQIAAQNNIAPDVEQGYLQHLYDQQAVEIQPQYDPMVHANVSLPATFNYAQPQSLQQQILAEEETGYRQPQGVQNGLQQGQKAAQEVNATQPAQVAPQAGQTAQPQTQAQPAAAPANQGVAAEPATKVDAFKQAHGVKRNDTRIARFLDELDAAEAGGQITPEASAGFESQLAAAWKLKGKDAVKAHNALASAYVNHIKANAQEQGKAAPETVNHAAAPETEAPVKPTNTEDLPAYKTAMQTWLTSTLSPEEVQSLFTVRGIVRDNLGDEDAAGASLRAAAKKMGVSHQTVSNRANAAEQKIAAAAKKAGIPVEVAEELIDLPTSNDVLDLPNTGHDNGNAVVRSESDDFEHEYGTERSETGDVESGETVADSEVDTPDVDGETDDNAGSVNFVAGEQDVTGNYIRPVDVEDALDEWAALEDTQLHPSLHMQWTKTWIAHEANYLSDARYTEQYLSIAEESEKLQRRAQENPGSQEQPGGESPVSPEGGTRSEGQRSEESAEGVKHSKVEQTGSTTSDAIRSKLKPLFFSGTRFDKIVTVVASTEALPANLRSEVDGNTQAFVQGGKVYMIAGNIAEGKELAVFLHEVGVHLGMAKLIGQENLTRLAMQIKRWATKNDGSQESELAKKALARVKSAQKGGVDMGVGDVIEERVAYFVEEAVNAGVNPQAIAKSGGPIAQWFRTLWAAAKAALRKFGLDRIDSLTPQNLVDLAYGAARMELEGTWHGTAADFRNFNHSYMGSGEGAQAFGWGTYLAQRVGIAKGYWKADVKRKGHELDAQGRAKVTTRLAWALRADDKLGFDSVGEAASAILNDGLDYAKTAYDMSPETVAAAEEWLNNVKEGNPEGSLMRVDTAVHEDEMLDWDKPVYQQGEKVVLALLTAKDELGKTFDGTGEEVYRQMERYFGSDKAASEYLDSIGIKGIKFLDSQSRGSYRFEVKRGSKNGEDFWYARTYSPGASWHSEQSPAFKTESEAKNWGERKTASQTRNLVIFNDKNVQRVSTQVGASRDRIKFSKTSEAVERNFGPSGRLAYETVAEAVKGAFRNSTKWLMSLHDLVGRYGHIIPSAGDWHKSVRATDAMRERLKEDAEQIAARASKLSNHVLAKMNEFIFQSTTQQKWGYDAEFAQIDGKMRKVEADPEMARKYDALKSLSPEAAKIAKDVFAHGEQMRLMQFQIMKDLGLKSLMPKSGGTLTGPYAPLKRFGDFVAVLKSQEVLDAEAAHDDKRLAELKKDEKHYVVKFFDTRARAKDFVRRSANYAYAQAFPKRVAVKEAGVGNAALLQKVMGAVKAEGLPADAKARMEDLINDMFLAAFDEQNARTQGLQRKNYAGADEDMIRSFLAGAKAQAGFLAHMKHGATTNELFYKMQSEAGKAKNREESTEVFNAIANHYAESLNYTDTPIQNAVTGATSVWQLATNPAYHVQNLMQPLVVSIPRLAADFGNYSGAWSAWLNGAKTALRIDPRNLDLSKLSENEAGLKGVLRYAEDAGLLNIGMDENIGQFERTRTGIGIVDTSSDLARKALHALRRISSSVEAMNRVSTAVAAYNMAKSSGKFKTEAEIQDYVVSVLQDTQGDFSKTDAPLVIKKLPKPVVQYRKFQLMMAAHYIKAVADVKYGQGVLDDPKSSAEDKAKVVEVRAVAKRMLAFSLGHAVMTAGALGIPMMNLVALAFSKMGGDDEPWDLERTLREKIGDEHMANMLLHGPLSYMGLDAKLAQDKVFSFLPYADWNLTSKEGVKNLVWGVAGPAGSNLQRVAGGLEYFSKGDTLKGVESVLPSGFANLVRAYRVANEGYTLKNGDVMIRPEDMAGLSMLLDAAGMKSPGMKSAEWFRNQQYEIKEFYQKHTKDIEHAYATAYREGDTAAMASAREDWTALQEGKDRLRYMFNGSMDELKRQPISTLLKYPHTAAKREAKLQKAVPATM